MCYSATVEINLDVLSKDFGAEIIENKFDRYKKVAELDNKKFPSLHHERIFPGYFAPVMYMAEHKLVIEPMRYGAEPPAFISDPKKYSTFNARRDNLESKFWEHMFLKHHGFVVIKSFYEWVKVSSLLKAGVVTIEEVKREFARQAEERKKAIELKGKPYKPTPTELKDARMRDIIISFTPTKNKVLLVPAIIAEETKNLEFKSFAVVTDDPPMEIKTAGHDRCPVILSHEQLQVWLHPEGHSVKEIQNVLVDHLTDKFEHSLPLAA